MPDKVFTLELFNCGEFSSVRVFKNSAGATREAARLLHEHLNDSDFAQIAGVEDVEEFMEFLDNMNTLFKNENWAPYVECWDEWVSTGAFAGPTPFNFDITEREVE